jgi:hypothetical protein
MTLKGERWDEGDVLRSEGDEKPFDIPRNIVDRRAAEAYSSIVLELSSGSTDGPEAGS